MLQKSKNIQTDQPLEWFLINNALCRLKDKQVYHDTNICEFENP